MNKKDQQLDTDIILPAKVVKTLAVMPRIHYFKTLSWLKPALSPGYYHQHLLTRAAAMAAAKAKKI